MGRKRKKNGRTGKIEVVNYRRRKEIKEIRCGFDDFGSFASLGFWPPFLRGKTKIYENLDILFFGG